MTTAEVYDLIHNKFDIGRNVRDHSTSANVFEVQALRALLAKQFVTDLNNMDQNQPVQIKELKSGPDFLAEAYGAAYDEDNPPTIEKAKRDAEKIWQKSGFETFLHGSIEKLNEKAAPRSIESALNHCHGYLYRLYESLTIRQQLLSADEQVLRHQGGALLADIQKLHDVMEKQKTALDDEQTRITTHFRSQVTQMKSDVREQLTRVLDDRILLDSADRKVAGMTNMENQTTPIFLQSYYHSVIGKMATVLRNQAISGGILKFKNEEEGRYFVRNIERRIRLISENASSTIRTDVDKECELAWSRLNQHLQENTQEIIKNVQNRLASDLDIKFEKPPGFDPVHPVPRGYELKSRKNYRPWWLLWLIPISYEEGTAYEIKISSLTRHCVNILENYMSAIENELNTYLTSVLKNNFDQHFDKLKNSLALYQDYVNKSLDDKARTIDEKATLKVSLVEFIKQINDQIRVVADIQRNFESGAYSTSVDVETNFSIVFDPSLS